VTTDENLEEVRTRIIKLAEEMLDKGTLVFAPGSRVAYAFVVPAAARDDLYDAFADLALVEDEDWATST